MKIQFHAQAADALRSHRVGDDGMCACGAAIVDAPQHWAGIALKTIEADWEMAIRADERRKTIVDMIDSADYGVMQGQRIPHRGEDLWIHTTGQVTAWLDEELMKAGGRTPEGEWEFSFEDSRAVRLTVKIEVANEKGNFYSATLGGGQIRVETSAEDEALTRQIENQAVRVLRDIAFKTEQELNGVYDDE